MSQPCFIAEDFRVDLRVAAAEPVLLVLGRFAFPRLVADFLVRLEAAADRLPPAGRLALPRLIAVLPAAFVVLERLLRLRGF
jgi:hypothetical protein